MSASSAVKAAAMSLVASGARSVGVRSGAMRRNFVSAMLMLDILLDRIAVTRRSAISPVRLKIEPASDAAGAIAARTRLPKADRSCGVCRRRKDVLPKAIPRKCGGVFCAKFGGEFPNRLSSEDHHH